MLTINMQDLSEAASEGCQTDGPDHIEHSVYVTTPTGAHVAMVPFDTEWSACIDKEDALALADVIAKAVSEWASNR